MPGPKVVSEGPVKTKRHVCGRCGYELEYTEEHIKEYRGTDLDGGSNLSRILKCPRRSCNYENLMKGSY